ncbi:MAG: metal ABC transporter substrate-binding protein [Candidatus Binatia bacterium]
MRVLRSFALAGLALFTATACPAVCMAAGKPVRIVTSIPPLAMIAAEMGGDRVTSHSILPPGADPHTFEPKPSDAIAIAEADLIIVLGSSIDDWIGITIAAPAGTSIVRLDEQHEDAHEHAGHTHDGGEHDPHVWLDPAWVRERAVPALQRALVAADPEGAARHGASARAMVEKLSDLEEDIREQLEGAATRSFLAWHPAWQHFARRFGLHSVGSVGEGGGREPSLHAMIAAVRAAKAAGVRAVLVEPQVDSRQASVLAGELAVPLVIVDPLGDAWSLDRATYRTLMLFNARAFGRALGVDGTPSGPSGSPDR